MNKYEFNAMQAPAASGKKQAPQAEPAAPSPAAPKKLKVAVPAAPKKADAQAEPAELGERGERVDNAAQVVPVIIPEPAPPPARQAAADDGAAAGRRPGAAVPRDSAKQKSAPGGEIIGQDVLTGGEFLTMELPVGDGTLSGGDEAGLVGLLLGDDEKPNPAIPGVSDRVHYLAMAAISVFPGLRSGAKKRESTLQPVGRPASRSDCERRCGSDGFCDPSSKFGCGGEHCGYLHERL
jgi:hypothetical protein